MSRKSDANNSMLLLGKVMTHNCWMWDITYTKSKKCQASSSCIIFILQQLSWRRKKMQIKFHQIHFMHESGGLIGQGRSVAYEHISPPSILEPRPLIAMWFEVDSSRTYVSRQIWNFEANFSQNNSQKQPPNYILMQDFTVVWLRFMLAWYNFLSLSQWCNIFSRLYIRSRSAKLQVLALPYHTKNESSQLEFGLQSTLMSAEVIVLRWSRSTWVIFHSCCFQAFLENWCWHWIIKVFLCAGHSPSLGT